MIYQPSPSVFSVDRRVSFDHKNECLTRYFPSGPAFDNNGNIIPFHTQSVEYKLLPLAHYPEWFSDQFGDEECCHSAKIDFWSTLIYLS